MIAPQELRIGNLVEYDGKIFKVKEIRNYIIVCDRGKGNVDFTSKEIEPIELTEEWLLKLGFLIDYMNKDVLICAYYGSNPVTNDYILELKNIGDGWFYRNGYFKIQYVHQVQNLISALTGEELTIKEQK